MMAPKMALEPSHRVLSETYRLILVSSSSLGNRAFNVGRGGKVFLYTTDSNPGASLLQ